MNTSSYLHSQPENNDAKSNNSQKQNISVFVRVRPLLKSEFQKEIAVTVEPNETSLVVNLRDTQIQKTADYVFNPEVDQQTIYQRLQQGVPNLFQGFNSTILAYGQTGSGKTHTVFGADWDRVFSQFESRMKKQMTFIQNIESDFNTAGIIPRAIHHVFKELANPEHNSKKFVVYCGFMQIYNEKIFDLLQENKQTPVSLQIRESKYDGMYVEGLAEYAVETFEECILLMKRGERNRNTRQTAQNQKSSRSHTIFQLLLESTIADANGCLQKSKYNFCDLAGSEKLSKQENIEAAHLQELKNINLSLTILGKVINCLSQKTVTAIPYRESKITRLLQDSLGGNTRTVLIATLNPTSDCVDETISTLKFAERASHITSVVKPNQVKATDEDIVRKLKQELMHLKDILRIRRNGESPHFAVQRQLETLQLENSKLRENQVSIKEVEQLIEENRTMKLELQKLRVDSQGRDVGGLELSESVGELSKMLRTSSNRSEFKLPKLRTEESGSHSNRNQLSIDSKSDYYPPLEPSKFSQINFKDPEYTVEKPQFQKGRFFNYRTEATPGRSAGAMTIRDSLSSAKTSTILSGISQNAASPSTRLRIKGRRNAADGVSDSSHYTSFDQRKIEERQKDKAQTIERLKMLERIRDTRKQRQPQSVDSPTTKKKAPTMPPLQNQVEEGKSRIKKQNSLMLESLTPKPFDVQQLRKEMQKNFLTKKREEVIKREQRKMDSLSARVAVFQKILSKH